MSLATVTLRERLDDAAARLAGAGVDTPRVDAEWLMAGALGITRGRLLADLGRALDDEAGERYESWIERRAAREPLQHIVGTQAFRDLTVRVGPDVLIPRPETEALVSWALELLPPPGRGSLAIDVGTGSGCIACALAWERPDVRVVATDASPAAVARARDNAVALGLTERVSVSAGDLFSGLAPVRADLVVSNPPYVPTGAIDALAPEITEHEPRLALDGGPDGLGVIRRLVSEAPAWLRPGAPLLLETFGDEQARQVVGLMRASGYANVSSRRDLAGVTRFVRGEPPRIAPHPCPSPRGGGDGQGGARCR